MSNKLQILIIEDELNSANKLSEYLHVLRSDIEILEIIGSVSDAVTWLQSHTHPQIIFLDIQLSDGLSFQIFEKLEVTAQVIFLTAYEQYAIRAFELNSIDYLLKPFVQNDIRKSLDKYERKTEHMNGLINQRIAQLDLSEREEKSRFMVKRGHSIISIPVEEIAYFYKDSVVFLVTIADEKYMIDYTLEQLEGLLNMKDFFRLNRQFICNYEGVKSVDRIPNNRLKVNLTPAITTEVIISQNKSALFKEWLSL